MIIANGEVYPKDKDISLLMEEKPYVKKMYGPVARTLSDSEILRISRGQAARMIGLGRGP